MTFDPNAQLDPTSVTDARGGGRMGGRGGGLAVGGGGLGLVIAIIYVLLGGNPGALVGGGSGTAPDANAPNSSALASCKTGTDANQREDCQIVGYVNSIEKYWTGALQGYTHAETTIFSEGVSTGCGDATSATGPFYCPPDKGVFLDLTFFEELERRFGAKDAPFARAYVLAHEYGHHVQNLAGDLQPGSDTGPTSRAVRTELQADCYAGVWANHAADDKFMQPLTPEEIAAADKAAAAVGDDHIQESSGGTVDPDSFSHGTSEQRVRWFTTGYKSGNPDDCDTFNATTL
ncbi:MAG: neutral zinc metallopeptidase [Chloroflexi bacterium]|nr:neutral zinc metallopeptidase [Chloroflexota bacterium]